MISTLFGYSDVGLLILRLAVGIPMILHGYPKILGFKKFSGWLESMKIKPGGFWAAMVILAEVVGGAALVAGMFTQFAAALIAVNMLVAIIAVKLKEKKFIGSWEHELLYFVVSVALIVLGPGLYSVDFVFQFWLW